MKQWNEYFSFTKRERNAVYILLTLIIVVSFLPKLFPPEPIEIIELKQTGFVSDDSVRDEEFTDIESTNFNLHAFDPNTVTAEQLQAMGFRNKLIQTIINYRNKGGKFFEANDIRRLYTIRDEEADRIVPFVKINSVQQTRNYDYPNDHITEKVKPLDHVIDINAAALEEIQGLPGVSPSLANKIFRYREVIGGFKTADQLKKTYGMNDSIFAAIQPWLKPFASKNNRININKATFKELMQSNLLSENVARAILIYREKHKAFQSVSELMNIPFISKETFEKIAPALTVE